MSLRPLFHLLGVIGLVGMLGMLAGLCGRWDALTEWTAHAALRKRATLVNPALTKIYPPTGSTSRITVGCAPRPSACQGRAGTCHQHHGDVGCR